MAVTIKDIAKMCGVSTTTISRVINGKFEGVGDETRERIILKMKELHYQPNGVARSMVTKKTNTIALLVPDICNPFFPELARGAEDVCTSNGFSLFLCNTDGDLVKEQQYIKSLRERLVDGIIFTTQNNEEYHEIFTKMLGEQYPFVFVERYADQLNEVPGVFIDNVQGAYSAVKHLINLGHKNIAFISGPFVTSNARMRFLGYQQAMLESNLDINYNLVKEGDYKVSGGYAAMQSFLEKYPGQFSAVFASNDLMAFGVYQAAREFGLKIPEDMSIMGFDNIPFPKVLEPKVTTVDIPSYEIGASAARMILDLINRIPLEKNQVTFPLQLVEKGSTCKAKSESAL